MTLERAKLLQATKARLRYTSVLIFMERQTVDFAYELYTPSFQL